MAFTLEGMVVIAVAGILKSITIILIALKKT